MISLNYEFIYAMNSYHRKGLKWTYEIIPI